MNGGEGNDTFLINGDEGPDTVNGGDGLDTILGGAGDDVIRVNTFSGANTAERVDGGSGNNVIAGTAANNVLDFSGTELLNIARIEGGIGHDTITGSSAGDTIVGGAGQDTMNGGEGNDTFLINGDEGPDTVNGGDDVDMVLGGAGDDIIRFNGFGGANMVEIIDGGAGNNIIAGTAANNVLDFSNTSLVAISQIEGGLGHDTLTGSLGDDFVLGGDGQDTLRGLSGNDLLQGGSANDTLIESLGNNLLDGGAGNDTIAGGTGNDFFAGGAGNDTITTGTGADIIAFNRNDGQDTVNATTGADNTLSIGGGVTYADMGLAKSGNHLIVKLGGTDQITLRDWYLGAKSVLTLQVVAETMAGFNPGSGDPLLNEKMTQFDFQGLANAFDQARAQTPGLTSWALTNAIASFQLSGSDTEALGGDLAYSYGKNGNFAGVGYQPAQDTLGAANFGSSRQTLQPAAELQTGVVRMG
jgi:Ca2+-binding RTX toxin-like protein